MGPHQTFVLWGHVLHMPENSTVSEVNSSQLDEFIAEILAQEKSTRHTQPTP